MNSPRPFSFTLGLVGLAFLGLTSGCGTVVTVDSLAKRGANPVSYELHNINPLLDDDSLRYQETADYIRTALSGKGMYEAPAKVAPDVVVSVDFGIGPPQTRRETVSEPVFIEVPGATRTETVQSGTDAQGRPIYSTVTYQDPPRTKFNGYREYVVTYTVYEKYLRLVAREPTPAAEGRPPAEIWTVDITSEGESRDLRKHLPLLVAASIDYIGQDSQGQKQIRIKDKDAKVVFVKKGMPIDPKSTVAADR